MLECPHADYTTTRQANVDSLPPELLNQIISYIPSAQTVANLSATSKTLQAYVQKEAWRTFNIHQFPSLCPTWTSSARDTARSLVTLSAAWDRRSFVTRSIEPGQNILAYPGARHLDQWQRPHGQTMGYTPVIDVLERYGSTWQDRQEVLAFTAGTEVCIRITARSKYGEAVKWATYRHPGAREGRDDLTVLHLLPDKSTRSSSTAQRLIVGSARGDLRLVTIPKTRSPDKSADLVAQDGREEIFDTQNRTIRCSAVNHGLGGEESQLVVGLDNNDIALYTISNTNTSDLIRGTMVGVEAKPSDARPSSLPRIWSTTFLDESHIIAGLGASNIPIYIYAIRPTGIESKPLRPFSLDVESFPKPVSSRASIYSMVALPSASIASPSRSNNLFLSGAYDGVIRLHDIRSARNVEQRYVDGTDDSPVYSLLPRGREMVVAGCGRHNLVKLFDLRMGSKIYSWSNGSSMPHALSDDSEAMPSQARPTNWNLFARSVKSATRSTPSAGSRRARRTNIESSVYSLAASSGHSPFLYVGVEDSVLELSFSGFADGRVDPTFFATDPMVGRAARPWWDAQEFTNLAMHDQTADLKLYTQTNLEYGGRDITRAKWMGSQLREQSSMLDSRWQIGSRETSR